MTKDGRTDRASRRIVWFTMTAFVLILLRARASLLFLNRQQQVSLQVLEIWEGL